DIVKFLIENGANTHIADNIGFTPLHDAAGSGNRDVVMLLLDYNVNINAVSKDGETPLSIAIRDAQDMAKKNLEGRNPVDIVELLLQYGAKVDDKHLQDCSNLIEVYQMILAYDGDL